ncbi:YjbH domain-containing protein [Alloyangia pacifica]|uniref:YjbH domain-containing protein n=1 Tax=Alloyangia pacifica TaxID=311180 RepID=UPI00299E8E2F|nr:YjbH domain-containing protein [Alloyangia pacifica]
MPGPKSGLRRNRRMKGAVPLTTALCLSLSAGPAIPQEAPWSRPTLNFMGVPGIIDMPTAHPMRDADLSMSLGGFEDTLRSTLHFQITPRLSGVFRYVNLNGFADRDYYDRSFDLRYLIANEGRYTPAVSVGLQDFGGTGIYGGEYLVATKTFGRLRATGGIGWGRFGSYNGFTNPLGVFRESFETRPRDKAEISQTGRVDTDQWFRGDAAFFGGLQYAVNDRLIFSAEYSSDSYERESSSSMNFEHNSPFNLGFSYRLTDGLDLSAAYLYGSTLAAQLSYTFNPKTPSAYPGGTGPAPKPVFLRPAQSLSDLGWTQQPDAAEILRSTLKGLLEADDMELERFGVEAHVARAEVRTGAQPSTAQAVGRVARVMSQLMPASVERFEITLVTGTGLPVSRVVLNRSDLEELEYAPDGAWQSYARAKVEDALPERAGQIVPQGAFPKYEWSLAPYLSSSYFDPRQPITLTLGAQLRGSIEPVPGLVLEGAVRQKLTSNSAGIRPSNSVLPHVRTDNTLYQETDDPTLNYLTATQYFRPGQDVFARVTAGYFEPMYGGISGEILWKPVDSRLGLGLEVNYAQQREYEQGFGFMDYGVVTGHASAYYKAPNNFHYQVDAGRYLAKDWGATFGVDREFDNGIRIGAFATFTDVSFDDFGEGSFDKGIRFYVPLSALTGERSDVAVSRALRPVLRDGGARLEVGTRLYQQVRQYQQPELQGQWGRFWR